MPYNSVLYSSQNCTLVDYLTLIKLKNQKMKERNGFKNHIKF